MRPTSPPMRDRTIGFLDGQRRLRHAEAGGGLMLLGNRPPRAALRPPQCAALVPDAAWHRHRRRRRHRHGHHRLGHDREGQERHLQARQQPAGGARRPARPLGLDLVHAAASSTTRTSRPSRRASTNAKAVSAAAQKQVRVVYGAREHRRRRHRHRHRLFRRARLGHGARAASFTESEVRGGAGVCVIGETVRQPVLRRRRSRRPDRSASTA